MEEAGGGHGATPQAVERGAGGAALNASEGRGGSLSGAAQVASIARSGGAGAFLLQWLAQKALNEGYDQLKQGSKDAAKEEAYIDALQHRLRGVDSTLLWGQLHGAATGTSVDVVQSALMGTIFAKEARSVGRAQLEDGSFQAELRDAYQLADGIHAPATQTAQTLGRMYRLGVATNHEQATAFALTAADAVTHSGGYGDGASILGAIDRYVGDSRVVGSTPHVPAFANGLSNYVRENQITATDAPAQLRAFNAELMRADAAVVAAAGKAGGNNPIAAALRQANPAMPSASTSNLMRGGLFATTRNTPGVQASHPDDVTTYEKVTRYLHRLYPGQAAYRGAYEKTFGISSGAAVAIDRAFAQRAPDSTLSLLQRAGLNPARVELSNLQAMSEIGVSGADQDLEQHYGELLASPRTTPEERGALTAAHDGGDREAYREALEKGEASSVLGQSQMASRADLRNLRTAAGFGLRKLTMPLVHGVARALDTSFVSARHRLNMPEEKADVAAGRLDFGQMFKDRRGLFGYRFLGSSEGQILDADEQDDQQTLRWAQAQNPGGFIDIDKIVKRPEVSDENKPLSSFARRRWELDNARRQHLWGLLHPGTPYSPANVEAARAGRLKPGAQPPQPPMNSSMRSSSAPGRGPAPPPRQEATASAPPGSAGRSAPAAPVTRRRARDVGIAASGPARLTDVGAIRSAGGEITVNVHLTADPVYLYDAASGARVGAVTLRQAPAQPVPSGVGGPSHPAAPAAHR